MTKLSKIVYFFTSFIFFVIFNQYFSSSILKNADKLPENNLFDLVFVQNQGAAFNILQGSKIFLISFSALAILGIIFYTIKHIKGAPLVAVFFTSMLSAGIFCNMYERIVYGYVRDYISLNFIDFPVFNISDIFINISVLVIVVIIVKKNYNKTNETDNR